MVIDPLKTTPVLMVAAAALIDQSGRVLVQQRPDGGSMAGLWEFPGGKIERGESPEDALCRELREELGISVDADNVSPLHFASAALDGAHLVLLLFICRAWRGAPAALHAADLRWVHPHELHEIAMPPADRPFIEVLLALASAPLPAK